MVNNSTMAAVVAERAEERAANELQSPPKRPRVAPFADDALPVQPRPPLPPPDVSGKDGVAMYGNERTFVFVRDILEGGDVSIAAAPEIIAREVVHTDRKSAG